MAEELQNDDFDFDSNDDDDIDGWGNDDDLDIIDDSRMIMQSSRQNLMNKEENACWKCKQCEMINNVRLSIEKENMKCCGCGNTFYIPDETETIQCSKWNNHNDYLLKIGVLNQIKVWICNLCTFQNKNIDAEYCEVCETPKTSTNIIKTLIIPANDIKFASISSKTIIKTNKEEIDSSDSSDSDRNIKNDWKCPNCNSLNKNNNNNNTSKCNVCECHRAIQFNNINLSTLITFGYIREFIVLSNLNIPTVINRLCQQYYTEYDQFQSVYYTEYRAQPFYQKIFEQNISEQNISVFTCYGGYTHNLLGSHIVKGPLIKNKTYNKLINEIIKPSIEHLPDPSDNPGISRWRIQLSLNEKIYDDEENGSSKKTREKVKFYGVAVGIVRCNGDGMTVKRCYGDGTIIKRCYKDALTGNMFADFNFAYGIHGNGKYHRYQQFCRGFVEDDMIIIELDGDKGTVSYGINDNWFGVAFENIEPGYYRLGICVKQRGVVLKCVEFVGDSLTVNGLNEIAVFNKLVERNRNKMNDDNRDNNKVNNNGST